MFFQRFDPRETRHDLFVDRESDQRWLRRNIEATLSNRDTIAGRSICVHGPKGSGKTIFARTVLHAVKARSEFLTRTVFVEVDCRRLASARAVFNAVTQGLVEGLLSLQAARVAVSAALINAAKGLLALTRFTGDVELKVAHEHIAQFKLSGGADIGLTPKLALPAKLGALFGISFERSEKEVRTLTGTVAFDEAGLCASLKELLADVRRANLDVVLFLDNIDELHHDYKDEATRQLVWQQAEWALELAQAPVVMLACMRSYYSGVARAFSLTRALDPVPENVRLGIIERRVKEEPEEVRTQCAEPPVKAMMNRVAGAASTPLACLQWFQAFAEEEAYDREAQQREVLRFVRGTYAQIPTGLIEKVVREFDAPDTEVDRKVVLDACGGNETLFAALQDREVILPNDFWNPLRFTLDPALHILHPTKS